MKKNIDNQTKTGNGSTGTGARIPVVPNEKTAQKAVSEARKAVKATSRREEAALEALAQSNPGGCTTIRNAKCLHRYGIIDRHDYVTVMDDTGETCVVMDLFESKRVSESKRHWLHQCGYAYLAIPRSLPPHVIRKCIIMFRMGQQRATAMGLPQDELAKRCLDGTMQLKEINHYAFSDSTPECGWAIVDTKAEEILLLVVGCTSTAQADAVYDWCEETKMQGCVFMSDEMTPEQIEKVLDCYFQGLTGRSLL